MMIRWFWRSAKDARQAPQEGESEGSGHTGLEDADFTLARERMVKGQLATPARGISHPGVLAVMGNVPRHEFVPLSERSRAYDDKPLPIGYRQTISQPFIVAFMTEHLNPMPADKVLEIGTGSGYQAAVLAGLVRSVYSIEIIDDLARRAEHDLKRLGYANVTVRSGDGYMGWPDAAPFDAVIVACAPDHVPQPLIEQLREGGRMIIPVGPGGTQMLHVLRKENGRLAQLDVLPVRFVPMTGNRVATCGPTR